MTSPSTTPQNAAASASEEFEVLLVSDDLEPGYAVFCPSLPGCISQGNDRDDALAMIVDAIEGFLMFSPRPAAPDGAKERLIAEYTEDGCRIEVASVTVAV
jgi:predicted RNase H-like HicB family nuclease